MNLESLSRKAVRTAGPRENVLSRSELRQIAGGAGSLPSQKAEPWCPLETCAIHFYYPYDGTA